MFTGTATPSSIETHFVNQFRDGISQAFQQTESVFEKYHERDTQKSEFQFWDRIGEADDMSEDTTRYGDNPMSEIEFDRRRIHINDFDLGKAIDEKDLKRVAEDPQNAYTQALVASTMRKKDDYFLDRVFDDAYTGKGGTTTIGFVKGAGSEDGHNIVVGSQSNGSSNKVTATDTAGANSIAAIGAAATEGISVGSKFAGYGKSVLSDPSGLTLAKLKSLRTTMLQLEAMSQDTVLYCFITAKQFEDLLGIPEVINSDYAVKKSLAEGQVTSFMGYRFIHSERLPLAGSERRCLVTLPKAYKQVLGMETGGDMWRLTGKKKIPYIYFKLCIGGSRMWGENTAEIRCEEG